MDFLSRLNALAKAKGLENKSQLSKASGVPYTTIDNFSHSGFENIKLSTLKKLASCLGCSLEYLVNGNDLDDSLSDEAIEIAHQYDKLDAHSREAVCGLIEVELKRPASAVRLPESEDAFADVTAQVKAQSAASNTDAAQDKTS